MPFHRMCVSARSNVFKAGISVLGLSFGLALSAGAACAQEVIVGLVTKTEVNPFFVKMRQAAEARAKEKGLKLIARAGKFDGDNEGQVAAIEDLISAGARAFLSRRTIRPACLISSRRRGKPVCW